MAPAPIIGDRAAPDTPTKASQTTYVDIIEAWGEGFNFGGLIILILIVMCNLRRHVLLHKLIVIEQVLALWHATIIFVDDPAYGWYLSSTVIPLYISYFMHNFISWMKIKPFLSKRYSWIYLGTLIGVQPYWAVALWTNYENFNGLGDNHYKQVRPWEALVREPWWVFTTIYLIWILKDRYSFGFWELIRSSPRFSILVLCMALSIILAIIDAAVVAVNLNKSNGINPFWRMSLVFKCASDTIFLDDFKRVFDWLVANALDKATGRNTSIGGHRTFDSVVDGDVHRSRTGRRQYTSFASTGHARSRNDPLGSTRDRTSIDAIPLSPSAKGHFDEQDHAILRQSHVSTSVAPADPNRPLKAPPIPLYPARRIP